MIEDAGSRPPPRRRPPTPNTAKTYREARDAAKDQADELPDYNTRLGMHAQAQRHAAKTYREARDAAKDQADELPDYNTRLGMHAQSRRQADAGRPQP